MLETDKKEIKASRKATNVRLMLSKKILLEIYQRLYRAYGPQSWWPADNPFEIMLGSILTQNTAWTNVEMALGNLKRSRALNLSFLLQASAFDIAELIRPSGYFNIKAKRLKNFAYWFAEQGRFRQLDKLEDGELRKRLLSVNGIGPETADDIMLYAFNRPVFVIDAYTRRLLLAFDLIEGNEDYETLRAYFESALGPDAELFQEYHALIVRNAKQKCSAIDDCLHCYIMRPLPG